MANLKRRSIKDHFCFRMNIYIRWVKLSSWIFLISLLSCRSSITSTVHEAPVQLKTEDRIDPIGIGDSTPEFSWITKDYSENKGNVQSAYQIIVASSPELLDENMADKWNSDKVISDKSAYITYDGQKLQSQKSYHWKVRTWNENDKISSWSAPAEFETGLLSDQDWQDAKWIWRDNKDQGSDYSYFRKEFQIPDKSISKARIYITACNRYELYINGELTGKGPNFAHPDEYYYQTFDIGPFLSQGQENVFGVLSVHWGRGGQGRPKGKPGLLFKATIEFADGSIMVWESDQTWKTHKAEEWKNINNYRNGEGIPYDYIDARLHPVGWNKPGYDDSKWNNSIEIGAHPVDPWLNTLIAQETSISEYEISPLKVTKLGKGHFVADFGKIYSGMPKLTFSGGEPGTLIKVKADYRQKEDGTLLGFSQNTKMDYEYTLRGGLELFRPFWYMAFRYLEVENAPPSFDSISIRMIVRHNKVNREQSHFECSDPMINSVWELAKRSVMLASHEQFLDTPTREQGQFTADAFLISSAVMKCFLERDLSQQAIREFAQSQIRYHSNTGKVNAVYPYDGKRDITDWTQQFICWAWEYYMQTGDHELIEEIFDQLVNTGNYNKNSENPQTGLIDWGSVPAEHKRGLRYPTGIVDWVDHYDYDVTTSQRTVLSINAYLNYLYLARLAEALGKNDVHAVFRQYADDILSAIQLHLWDKDKEAYIDGLYEDGTKSKHASQQANAMMLALSLAKEGQEQGMIKTVKNAGHRTGVLLIRYLIQAYGEFNEDDALFEFLTNTDGNNWAYAISNGGTFTWENWRLTEETFSESHGYGAYGAVCAVQDYILGVKPVLPQYASIQVKPHLTGNLEFAKGKIPTQRGQVFVEWENKTNDNTFYMKVCIPFNMTADIYVPKKGQAGRKIMVNGSNKSGKEAGDYVLFEKIKPGEHVFIRKY